LLAVVLLSSLFPVGVFARDFVQNTSGEQTASALSGTVMGHVGPSAAFAPWWWYNDDPGTGTVMIGGGVIQGASGIGLYTTTSPWNAVRDEVVRIVFTEPVTGGDHFSSLFRNLTNLIEIEQIAYLDTSSVRWFSDMFRGASSLTNLDLSTWDTSNVTRFTSMFRDANNLEHIAGIETWNTGSLHTMPHMFRGASSLTSLDLSLWNTSGVTGTTNEQGMAHAFRDTNSLMSLNLGGWDTSGMTGLTMANMFTGATALRELTLGAGWTTIGDPNLPNPPNNAAYTGFWTNVGDGIVYRSDGTHTLTSAQLMDNANAGIRADTWVWQARIPLLLVTFTSAGNGTVTPALTGVEPNQTIYPLLAIYPVPDTGYQFLHWTSSDPGHGGGLFQTQELHGLVITQDTTFTAHFAPLSPDTHLVTFLLNGGYVDGYPDPHMVTISDGNPITEANVPIPSRPNHNFLGWRENGTGPLLSRAEAGALTVTDSRSFTAQWQRILHTVTFDLGGGSYDRMIGTVVRIIGQGNQITTAQVPAPARPGWEFRGWMEDGAAPLLNRVEVGVLVVSTDRLFVAQWEQETSLAARQAYLIGADDGLIRPNANITRAEVATMFFRLITDEARTAYWSQENSYSDVSAQDWFNNAISTMTDAGVFNGLPDGSFAPNQTITRAEMVAVIVRFMEQMDGMTLLGNFFDDIADHWAADYINTAAVNGWVQGPYGMGGAFYPDRPLTRAEAAAVINRISGRLVERTEDLLPDMRTWPDNDNTDAWYYFYIQSATNSYTFQWRGAGNGFEHWLTMIPPRDWAALERPDSRPGDL